MSEGLRMNTMGWHCESLGIPSFQVSFPVTFLVQILCILGHNSGTFPVTIPGTFLLAVTISSGRVFTIWAQIFHNSVFWVFQSVIGAGTHKSRVAVPHGLG